MSKNRILNILSLCCNLTVVALTIRSVLQFFLPIGRDDTFLIGVEAFKYFTVLSNIFVGLTCLVIAVFNVINLIKDKNEFPLLAERFKYVAVCATSVTMLTVLFFLGPTQGWGLMYLEINLYMHLISPLLALISYVIVEAKTDRKFYESTFGCLPVLMYGAVYLSSVLVFKTRNDFYGFNREGMWYISIIAMLIATYAISVGIHYLAKLVYFLFNKTKS